MTFRPVCIGWRVGTPGRTGLVGRNERATTLGRVSETLRLVAGALLAGAGVALFAVAVLGARSRLPRNRFAGVRTAATLRSDSAFALGNRVAAVPLGAAGAVAGLGGAAAVLGGPGAAAWIVLAITGAGTLVLAGFGGAMGDRAAVRMADREPEPSGCSGTCAGCDLVAGCRPGTAPASDATTSDAG